MDVQMQYGRSLHHPGRSIHQQLFRPYNKVYSNTEAGVAFIGDEANAFKFTHNLILLNRNGVVFNLDERGGSGVSNGSTFDDQNHCEGNSESCFKFVSGQFYTVHIAATYNELTVPNSSWIKIQNDGVPGHQLILNNLLINASGGYASGGAPIIDVDTSKGYAVPPAHISSIVRDGAGNVTVTTATPHGITCTTASCPYVAVTNAAMPAPMVQIKSVPDPTHLILIWGGPATTSSGGTVTLAHDRANVFLDSMGWRTSSSNQTAIHATGPGAVVRVGPIALFDSLGNFTNAESPSTLKTAEGGTIQVQSFTNH